MGKGKAQKSHILHAHACCFLSLLSHCLYKAHSFNQQPSHLFSFSRLLPFLSFDSSCKQPYAALFSSSKLLHMKVLLLPTSFSFSDAGLFLVVGQFSREKHSGWLFRSILRITISFMCLKNRETKFGICKRGTKTVL